MGLPLTTYDLQVHAKIEQETRFPASLVVLPLCICICPLVGKVEADHYCFAAGLVRQALERRARP